MWLNVTCCICVAIIGPNIGGLLLQRNTFDTRMDYRTVSPGQTPTCHLPSAVYLFCNKTLWVTFRVAPSTISLEDRDNILCICMRCFQTVAYLISCCVWLTSFVKMGTVHWLLLNSLQKGPKCELCGVFLFFF